MEAITQFGNLLIFVTLVIGWLGLGLVLSWVVIGIKRAIEMDLK